MIFRVSCEEYDMSWLVNENTAEDAIEVIRLYTESLGWNELAGETIEPEFDADEILMEKGEFIETRDI